MPAIVLLSKIFYRHDSFQTVMKDLSVSAEALKFRLLDIFRFYTNEKYDTIIRTISAYQRGVVNGVLKFFDEIKEKIEKLGLELGMTFSDRLMTALEAESVRVRSEAEESK